VTETRIAVVDDDAAVRELLELILADGGYAPTSVPAGPDLVARLTALKPAAIILDWRVDGGDGAAFDRIRADGALHDTPVVICTGDLDGMRRHAPRLATLPNVVIVEKPFQVDVLLSVLERTAVAPASVADGAPPSAAIPDRLSKALARPGPASQARSALSAIRADGGWACAELWLPDRGLLRCVAGVADSARRGFVDHSRSISLVPGFGLPGRVVSSRRPAWIPAVQDDRNFPRAPAARRFGVRAAAGVPIPHGGAVIGVLCGYAAHRLERDDAVLTRMASAATGLGPWLNDVRGALLRPDRVSRAAGRLAQEATVHAEVVAIDLLDAEGALQRAAVAHRDPHMAEVALRLEAFSPREEGPVAVAIRTRTPQRMGVSDATLRRWSASPEHLLVLRGLELRSVVAVPLVYREEVLGGIALSSTDPAWQASEAASVAIDAISALPAHDALGRLVQGRQSRR
jgi:CheY-like chemotaxis protein/GAF domain-containing protein